MTTILTQSFTGSIAMPVCLVALLPSLIAAQGHGQAQALERQAVRSAALVLTEVTEVDYNGDGTPDQRLTTTNTYDRRGNLATRMLEWDENGDGIVEHGHTFSNTYDRSGHLLTQIGEGDFPDEDVWRPAVWRMTNTYDRHGTC